MLFHLILKERQPVTLPHTADISDMLINDGELFFITEKPFLDFKLDWQHLPGLINSYDLLNYKLHILIHCTTVTLKE